VLGRLPDQRGLSSHKRSRNSCGTRRTFGHKGAAIPFYPPRKDVQIPTSTTARHCENPPPPLDRNLRPQVDSRDSPSSSAAGPSACVRAAVPCGKEVSQPFICRASDVDRPFSSPVVRTLLSSLHSCCF
jgi:hypothetical protein